MVLCPARYACISACEVAPFPPLLTAAGAAAEVTTGFDAVVVAFTGAGVVIGRTTGAFEVVARAVETVAEEDGLRETTKPCATGIELEGEAKEEDDLEALEEIALVVERMKVVV